MLKKRFLLTASICLAIVMAAAGLCFSVAPSAPKNIAGSRSASGNSFTISWSSPSTRTNGQALNAGEVTSYKIYRLATLGGTTGQTFTVLGGTSTSLTDNTVQGRTLFYKVHAVNNLAEESPGSETASSDSDNTVYVLADDGISYVSLSGSAKSALNSQNFSLRGRRSSSEEGNRIYKMMTFEVVDNLTGLVQNGYVLSQPARIALAYTVDGTGNVVSAVPGAASLPSAAGAKSHFSVYWHNGAEWLKVPSSVDTTGRTATVQSRLTGAYQLRLVQQPLTAQMNAVYPRTITPNGDGINDIAFFLFENPSGALASGTIFDITSSKVAGAQLSNIFSGDTVLTWDGKDDSGAAVAAGVYLYKLSIGDKTFTGTITVAR